MAKNKPQTVERHPWTGDKELKALHSSLEQEINIVLRHLPDLLARV